MIAERRLRAPPVMIRCHRTTCLGRSLLRNKRRNVSSGHTLGSLELYYVEDAQISCLGPNPDFDSMKQSSCLCFPPLL
ncbi:hypothetical protein NDU88_011906 [Pleurodeles waltl]|uniref:Uncharacterized protein n=1 Tax=Pleurodeles waltl TaxID=8319 RepID=A0AAV7S7N8_PLEWA|nr:hypothetical protein NDU88_011906 [Pleurodeles waltl]